MKTKVNICVITAAGCLAMAFIDGIWQPGYRIKSAFKMLSFAFLPIVYSAMDKQCGIRKVFGFHRKGLKIAAILAVSVYILIISAYFIGQRFIDFSAVAGEKFDLVAANLPYVTEEEYPTLSPEVREFEPRLALVAGDGGMALIARAVRDLAGFLTPGGKAIFELSPPQAPRLERMFAETGAFAGIEVIQDYTRRDRFVAARRNG